jgi:ribosomal-protein-alanine acetyltransferase
LKGALAWIKYLTSKNAQNPAQLEEGLPVRMPADSRPPPPGHAGLTVREARHTDIDALAKLEAECFSSDRLSRRSLASLTRSTSAFVVLASRDTPVGYAVLLTRRGTRSARLYSIAVSPATAGGGVGTCLLQAVEEEAGRRGASRMHLEVRADNAAAIHLYEKMGYRRVGRRDDYYEDGAPALLFARPLSPARQRRLNRAA